MLNECGVRESEQWVARGRERARDQDCDKTERTDDCPDDGERARCLLKGKRRERDRSEGKRCKKQKRNSKRDKKTSADQGKRGKIPDQAFSSDASRLLELCFGSATTAARTKGRVSRWLILSSQITPLWLCAWYSGERTNRLTAPVVAEGVCGVGRELVSRRLLHPAL